MTRAAEIPSTLRVTAFNDGVASSSALIATGHEDLEMQNVEAIDNRGLELPSLVYTIGEGQALSINFSDDAEGVEIGVSADTDTKTILRFEGVDMADGLSLLDKEKYSLTSLYEGMEIELDGAAIGRFFLTRAAGVAEIYYGLEWSVYGNLLLAFDRAASGWLEVRVVDTLGRVGASETTEGDTVSVALNQGVYVVEMANGVERKSVKIRI